MIDHDKNVGDVLNYLDTLGIADDTFVMYSTDNGPHRNSWPDGGTTPFRSEKNTNWEGAFRVPMLVRWPNKIAAGSVSTEIVQHHDWFPTFLAMAGEPDILEKAKKGYDAIGRTYKNHIDGYNLVPYLTGQEKESPRKLFVYLSDDGDVLALRYDNWKVVFMEQRCQGTLQVWSEPFIRLRLPKLFNLRTDPLRIFRRDVEQLLRVVPLPRLHPVRGLPRRGRVGGDVQGISAGAKAEQLHHRPCAGDDRRSRNRKALKRFRAAGSSRRPDREISLRHASAR